MNESYKELLVKREKGAKEALIRIASVVFTVLLGILTLLTGNIYLFVAVIVFGVLDYFVFQWTDIEFGQGNFSGQDYGKDKKKESYHN